MNQHSLHDWALFLNRLTLGLYVCFAGWRKVAGGVGDFVAGAYAGRQPGWLPEFIAIPYGYAIPWLELILGAVLVVGFYSRLTAAAMTVLLLTITIALAGTGDAISLAPSLHHAPVMTTLALLLAVTGAGSLSVDAWLRRNR